MIWNFLKRRLMFLIHRNEIQALFLFFISTFITFSLITHSSQDICWRFFTNAHAPISNWCGPIGAHISALLIYLFGVMAYAFIPLGFFTTYQIAYKRSWATEWDRNVAFVLLIACGSALCSLHGFDFISHHVHGGLIGASAYHLLHRFFDGVGSGLALYTMLCATAVVGTRLSIFQVMKFGVRGTVKLGRLAQKHKVAQRILFAGARACASALYPIKAAHRFGRSLLDGSAFIQTGLEAPECADECLQLSAMVMPEADQLNESFNQDIQKVSESAGSEQIEFQESKMRIAPSQAPKKYMLPQLDIFMGVPDEKNDSALQHELEQRAHILEEKLERFGISGKVVAIKRGPVVTLFEYQPEIDTKLSKILALEDDLAMALQALSIRILAPIPGKSVVGFEVANKKRRNVLFSSSINSKTFTQFKGSLPLVLGEDTIGNEVIVDLARMPHLLIAGSTGSGKSVALNGMLISLLCKRSPQELRLILIDPKRLEFAPYADIAHLLFPIITDPRKAAPILRYVVHEMEHRYETMALIGARNIIDYNDHQKKNGGQEFPYIVVVIDELSDLMLTAGREIEDLITRLAQMARAAGIHMIVATQRPSVDVITGLIKVNFPSRISFRVTSKIDSRTILDCGGAEKLLGRGDMLFMDSSASHMSRVHGAYVSDEEISAVVSHIRKEQTVVYQEIPLETTSAQDLNDADDQLYQEVLSFLDEVEDISISLLQRRFRIGYNRSARIIEMLEAQGRIMPADGSKTRKIIR